MICAAVFPICELTSRWVLLADEDTLQQHPSILGDVVAAPLSTDDLPARLRDADLTRPVADIRFLSAGLLAKSAPKLVGTR
jgi:hypothetical protein